jgi:predicted O-methyltransferase YrrM
MGEEKMRRNLIQTFQAIAERAILLAPKLALRIPRIGFHSGLGQGAWLLHGLVMSMKASVCVEIGSARGCSACYIGLALRQLKRGKLFAIDPHTTTDWNDSSSVDTYAVMRRNLRAFGVERYVEVIRKYSGEVAKDWKEPIDLLFIDGDHSYEGVKGDWQLFFPHVRRFGAVVFHDTIWDVKRGFDRPQPVTGRRMGVPRFVEELRRDGYPVITIDQHCGISLVQPAQGGVQLSKTL